jgi:hypothetical protein
VHFAATINHASTGIGTHRATTEEMRENTHVSAGIERSFFHEADVVGAEFEGQTMHAANDGARASFEMHAHDVRQTFAQFSHVGFIERIFDDRIAKKVRLDRAHRFRSNRCDPHRQVSKFAEASNEFGTATRHASRHHFRRKGKRFEFQTRVHSKCRRRPPLSRPKVLIDEMFVHAKRACTRMGSK